MPMQQCIDLFIQQVKLKLLIFPIKNTDRDYVRHLMEVLHAASPSPALPLFLTTSCCLADTRFLTPLLSYSHSVVPR